MPAPITTSDFGTAGSDRAPVESTIDFWSTSTPGSGVGSEPVAMTIFLAVRFCTAPSGPVTVTLFGPAILPKPT